MKKKIRATARALSTGTIYEVEIAIFLFSKKRIP
jgi:hypothetical protein